MATGTITINSGSNDGYVWYSDTDYTTAHNASSSFSPVNHGIVVGQKLNQNETGGTIFRGVTYFDTTGLKNATINGATAQLYLFSPGGKFIVNPTSTTFSVVMQNGQIAGQDYYPHNPLEVTDYYYGHYSGTGASLHSSACVEGSYNNFVFNATGLGWINTTATTKLMWRSSRDINSTAPVSSSTANVVEYMYFDEEHTSTNVPKLIINYTIGVPTVVTSYPVTAQGIGQTTAVVYGYLSADGGEACHPGFQYGPTTAYGYTNTFEYSYNSPIQMAWNLQSLTGGTLYHFRAFAYNAAGTGYGADDTFTTLPASIPTLSISNIIIDTSSSVSVPYTINSVGGANATARGVCYATATTPTTANSVVQVTGGSYGAGNYSASLTGLSTGVAYYTRAFAINSGGVGYSNQVGFSMQFLSSQLGLKTGPFSYLKSHAYYRTFNLGGVYHQFTYSFPFSFSSDGHGLGVVTKPPEWIHTFITFIRWLPSKDNPLLLGISTSPMVKNLSFNRQISTQLGIVLVQQLRAALKRVLSTTVGLIPSSLQRFSFIRQISTKVGALPLIKNAGNIKRDLFTQVAVYTKGLWSGYNYCKIVTINPSTDGALSSYPIKLTIHRTTGTDSGSDVYVGTDCSFDYSDIYFDTVEGVALWYWIESYTDDYAVVWIKAINIPASPTTTQIRFYYGSSIISARNSGVNTFTFFDDFNAGLSKWTTDSGCSIIGEELVVQSTSTATKTAYSNTSFGINYAMRARLKSAHISGNYIEDASISDAVDGYGVGVSYTSYYSAYNNTYYNLNVDDGRTYSPVSGWVAANTYYLQDIIRNGSTDSKFYVNNLNYVSVTGVDVDSHPIRFFTTNNTAKLTIDWVLIRPWTASEPSFGAWGSKVTTADSPFKNYLLKVYTILSTKVGLIATKATGLAYKFIAIKIGLSSSISSAIGFIKSFTNNMGLKSDILKSLSFTRIFNISTGVVSNLHRSMEQVLATSIGMLSYVSYLHFYTFITNIGLVASFELTRGWQKILATALGLQGLMSKGNASSLSTTLGLSVSPIISTLGRSFSTVVGVTSSLTKLVQINNVFETAIGINSSFRRLSSTVLSTLIGLVADVFPKSGGRVREFISSLGLVANYDKAMSRSLQTFIGLVTVINKTIAIQQVLQSLIAVTLVSDMRAVFEEVLHTVVGLIVEIVPKVGGRVREFVTSIGLVSEYIWLKRGSYYEALSTVIGLIGQTSVIGLGKSLMTQIGLIATIRTSIGKTLVLTAVVGVVSFLHRRRDDIEVLTTILGMKVTSLSSSLFGHKRFKSLKFLDRKTSDNKKLRIKK